MTHTVHQSRRSSGALSLWERGPTALLFGLYHLVVLPGSILLYPFLLFGKRAKLDLKQRYGSWGDLPKEVVWLHGASVGEVNGLRPLILGLRELMPNIPVLMTCATSTGLERAREIADVARLLPIDHPYWIKKSIDGLKIHAFIFGETELWPALLKELNERGVPCILVNARISDFSFKRYRAIRSVVASILDRLSLILATTQPSADRLRDLGAAPSKVVVTGNAKYDVAPSVTSSEKALQLKNDYFNNDAPVLTLASIRPGEEDIWFKAIRSTLGDSTALNVIVAPRHREKFDYFAQQLTEKKFSWVRWSERKHRSDHQGAQFILLDTFGDLEQAYSFSNVAFIGGSSVDFGGHNPLEAAAYGCFVCMGPYVSNVKEIVEDLLSAQAFRIINSEQDACAVIEDLVSNLDTLKISGRRGIQVWQQHRGATGRILSHIAPFFRRTTELDVAAQAG